MPAEIVTRVAGVVLAAGGSTRYGCNKLLLTIGGETLARRAARVALEAELEPVVCVVGHEAGRVLAALDGLPVAIVVNEAWARGMNTSLGAGIAALSESSAAAVVLLADMPLVTSAMVRRLVAEFHRSGAPLVTSDYGGVQAPPMLYTRALFPELGGGEGEGAGKRVVQRHEAELLRVPWPADLLADVDREGDLERVCAATT
jgi:molybdenum cofactor cytidylyltransferase